MKPEHDDVLRNSNRKIFGLVLCMVLIVIFVVAAVWSLNRPKNTKVQPDQSRTQLDTTNPSPTSPIQKPPSFPTITVNTWKVLENITVPVIETARIYQFKQNISSANQTTQQISLTTGAKKSENEKRLLAVQTDTQGKESAVYYFVKETGSFLYTDGQGVSFPANSDALSDQEKVTSYVRNLLNDETLHIAAHYEKKAMSGIKYYELHRDWNVMGLPIYNMLGLFNIPKGTPLSSLTLNQSPAKQARNDIIINTSDGADGFERNDDFNTITVGVRDGKIVSMLSTIRPMQSVGNQTNLISYSDALNRLTTKKYTALYISPESVEHAVKDAPQNDVTLSTANVSEVTVAYLETLPVAAQQRLEPYYIFRGTGTLENGKSVQFLASVAAITNNVLGERTQNERLLALENPANGGQQQGILDMSGNPVDTVALTPALDCVAPNLTQLINTITGANGTVYGQYTFRDQLEWYFIPPAGFVDLTVFQSALDQLLLTVSAAGEVRNERDIPDVLEDIEQSSADCPIRLSGSSPTIFAYSTTNQDLTITSGARLTLSTPAASTNSWTVKNGITTPYLYYEYVPVDFATPTQGWTVEKSNLALFAASVSAKLGLTKTEAVRALYELNHAAKKVSAHTLFIGVINADEVNAKLPLSVSNKQTAVTRVHFYVGAAHGEEVNAPKLNAVKRTSSYILEIGATAAN